MRRESSSENERERENDCPAWGNNGNCCNEIISFTSWRITFSPLLFLTFFSPLSHFHPFGTHLRITSLLLWNCLHFIGTSSKSGRNWSKGRKRERKKWEKTHSKLSLTSLHSQFLLLVPLPTSIWSFFLTLSPSFSLSYPSTLFLPLSGTITQAKSQVFETHPIHASLSLFTSCRFCNFLVLFPILSFFLSLFHSRSLSLSLCFSHSLRLSIEGGTTWKHGFKTQEKNHRERPIVIEWERRAEH